MIADAMKHSALEQIAAAGRRGLIVTPGSESLTQTLLVDEGLVWQEVDGGCYKFTISEAGRRALGQEASKSDEIRRNSTGAAR